MASQHATQLDGSNTPQDGYQPNPSAGDRGQVLPLPGEDGPALRELGDAELSTMSARFGQSDPKREGRREQRELNWKFGEYE